MKFVFATALLILISLNLNAQQFYLQGGGNVSSMNLETYNEAGEDVQSKVGFNIGLLSDVTSTGDLTIRTGLIFTQKGYKVDLAYLVGDGGKLLVSMNYFELPVLLTYNFLNINEYTVYGLTGPYVGLGLFGQAKFKTDNDTDSQTISWGNEDGDQFRRLDGGIIAGIGVSRSGISLQWSYNLGLVNTYPSPQDHNYDALHRYGSFSLIVAI